MLPSWRYDSNWKGISKETENIARKVGTDDQFFSAKNHASGVGSEHRESNFPALEPADQPRFQIHGDVRIVTTRQGC